MIKPLRTFILTIALTVLGGVVAYASTTGIFIANTSKTIIASVTDTQGLAMNSEQYLLTVNKDAGVNSVTVKVGATAISPATSGGNTYWINKGANPTITATAKSGSIIKSGTGSTGTINATTTVNVSSEPIALKFSSDSNFTLSAVNKGWNGTLQYSTDHGSSWNTWNGNQLSGSASTPIYLRGTGNTKIAGGFEYAWTFTGKYCIGNIETLLNYQTVANGQHPTMDPYCFTNMFSQCHSLTIAPSLPATTLTRSCYAYMFYYCSSLIIAPQLPATTLADCCYDEMFIGCDSLTTPPQLPATTLKEFCYMDMFCGCTSLKLSTSKTGSYQYAYRIPRSGTGTTATDALTDMFSYTGGTFKGTPTINTTYYTDHKPV